MEPRRLFALPTALANVHDQYTNEFYDFSVTYYDDGAVDASSIDGNDLQLVGPWGDTYDVYHSSGNVLVNGDGSLTARYYIFPPNALWLWDAANNGTYTLHMRPGQVLDDVGGSVPAGPMAQFTVLLPYVSYSTAPISGGSEVEGISNNGVVTGTSSDGFRTHGWVWQNGVRTQLSDVYGTLESPVGGISSNGVVVFSETLQPQFGPRTTRVFTWQNGVGASVFQSNSGERSWFKEVRGINNSGQIIGQVSERLQSGSFVEYAAVLSNGVIRPLLLTNNFAGTFANHINDNGYAVGYEGFMANIWPSAWRPDGSYIALSNLNGSAYDVSNANKAVGYVEKRGDDDKTHYHAMVWDLAAGGAETELRRLPGDTDAQAIAINANGQIIGESWGKTSNNIVRSNAVMWAHPGATPVVIRDLIPLMSVGSIWPRVINDNGHMATGGAIVRPGAGPSPRLPRTQLNQGGGQSFDFAVTLSDPDGIDLQSLRSNPIVVTAPNGTKQGAQFVAAEQRDGNRVAKVTYRINAPSGTWRPADDGQYAVALLPQKVRDTVGMYALEADLGTFSVAITDVAPTMDALSVAPSQPRVGDTLTLTASGVGDADGTVSSVAFYRESNGIFGLQVGVGGDAMVGIDSGTAGGWTVEVATATMAPGSHTFYSRATDNSGAFSSPASADVTLAAPSVLLLPGGGVSISSAGSSDDDVQVTSSPDLIWLTHNGISYSFPSGDVTGLVLNTGDGSDRIALVGGFTGTITFAGAGARPLLDFDDGTHHIRLEAPAGALPRVNISGAGDVRLTAGGASLGSLTMTGSARFGLSGSAQVLLTEALVLSTDARLDLRDNDMIVRASSAASDAVLSMVTGLVRSARNQPTRWTGDGITSSTAAGMPLAGLAVALTTAGTFSGVAVTPDDVLVKHTYNGDANLDGRINADDYFRIDQGFLAQPANPTYLQGDFNYDGRINADDYFLIDQAFLGQGAPLTAGASIASTTTASVVAASVPAEPQEKVVRKRTVRPIFSDEPLMATRAARRTSAARRR